MTKLAALVAGVAVLFGMTALAQTTATGGGKPESEQAAWIRGEQQIEQAHHMAAMLHNIVAKAEPDPATRPLMLKAFADRKVMLQTELERVTKLEALHTAVQEADRNAIERARENLKGSNEAVLAAAKAFIADFEAIHHTLVEHGAKTGAAGTGTAAPETAK